MLKRFGNWIDWFFQEVRYERDFFYLDEKTPKSARRAHLYLIKPTHNRVARFIGKHYDGMSWFTAACVVAFAVGYWRFI